MVKKGVQDHIEVNISCFPSVFIVIKLLLGMLKVNNTVVPESLQKLFDVRRKYNFKNKVSSKHVFL